MWKILFVNLVQMHGTKCFLPVNSVDMMFLDCAWFMDFPLPFFRGSWVSRLTSPVPASHICVLYLTPGLGKQETIQFHRHLKTVPSFHRIHPSVDNTTVYRFWYCFTLFVWCAYEHGSCNDSGFIEVFVLYFIWYWFRITIWNDASFNSS